jgi:2-keto-4-pentenoate hydratase/2-oxohepta-3-ene-1,7-dioic acid hydratase in catechol pathway
MKLATILWNGQEQAVIDCAHGLVLIDTLNQHTDHHWHTDIYKLIVDQQLSDLEQWTIEHKDFLHTLPALTIEEVQYAPLYRYPRKIWGIGMNYTTDESIPLSPPDEAPVSFMKPDTALIGQGDNILLPIKQTGKVTAEAELALIIGQKCHHVSQQAH